MSTRSLICKENPDHTYTGIYCHYDGYPDHNGRILVESYNDRNKVEELVALGGLSSLGSEVAPPPGVKHTWEEPVDDVCVAYHRDRGEHYESPCLVDPAVYKDSWCEYLYIFGLDGKWRYFNTKTDNMQKPKEFTQEWAHGYYEQTPHDAKCSLTIDDIINGVWESTDSPEHEGEHI